MSDFGANIFDDDAPQKPAPDPSQAPAAKKPKPTRRRRGKAADDDGAATTEGGALPQADFVIPPPSEVEPAAAPDPEPPLATAAVEPARRPPKPAQERRREPEPASPRTTTSDGPVVLLVDLDALDAEARRTEREVAPHRLLHGLAGRRRVHQAIALVRGPRMIPRGFAAAAASDADGLEALTATARQLLGDGHVLVAAPATRVHTELAATLRRDGHEVELVGLSAPKQVAGFRELPRTCLFVP
jgi:hypothetical protein